MKRSRTIPAIMATTAFLGSLGTLAASTAAQQPPAAKASAPAAMPDYTPADLRAVLNARIAALKAIIDLTPEQEKLWPPVEAAIRDIARNGAERLKQRNAAKPANFLDVLNMVAAGEEARAADIRKFVAAAKPLVASLSDAQKRRMPAFLGMTDYPGQPSGNLWIFQDEEG
jgi:hypothetical protein